MKPMLLNDVLFVNRATELKCRNIYAGFKVLIAVVKKSEARSPLKFNRRFGGIYRIHLQPSKKPAKKQVASRLIVY
jgi:hypothetical protein